MWLDKDHTPDFKLLSGITDEIFLSHGRKWQKVNHQNSDAVECELSMAFHGIICLIAYSHTGIQIFAV